MSHDSIKRRAQERNTKVYPTGNDPSPLEYFGEGSFDQYRDNSRIEIKNLISQVFKKYFLKIDEKVFLEQLDSLRKTLNNRDFDEVVHTYLVNLIKTKNWNIQKLSTFDNDSLINMFYWAKNESDKRIASVQKIKPKQIKCSSSGPHKFLADEAQCITNGRGKIIEAFVICPIHKKHIPVKISSC